MSVVELLPLPAERDMPPGSIARQKAMLLELIAADGGAVEAGVVARFQRQLGIILRRIGLMTVILAVLGALFLATSVGGQAKRVATISAVGGAVAIAATTTTQRHNLLVRSSRIELVGVPAAGVLPSV
jgi:hypothetical protein